MSIYIDIYAQKIFRYAHLSTGFMRLVEKLETIFFGKACRDDFSRHCLYAKIEILTEIGTGVHFSVFFFSKIKLLPVAPLCMYHTGVVVIAVKIVFFSSYHRSDLIHIQKRVHIPAHLLNIDRKWSC